MTDLNLADERHVVVHTWCYTESGDQEHCYFEEADGFCVYFRFPTPQDPQQPFDISDEKDFQDLQAALDYAKEVCILRGCSHIEEDF